MKVLVVEDNAEIASNICDYLTLQQHLVEHAVNGLQALSLVKSGSFDVIILDIILPGLDGLELCKIFRQVLNLDTSIIMLTARDSLNDKISGFDVGADDYLVKPFALAELSVRIQALKRRSLQQSTRQLRVADLNFNLDTLVVERSGEEIKLTPFCLKILTLLMQSSPNVVTKKLLEESLWQDDLPDKSLLKIHMHALRTSIDKPFDRPLIETVYGVGYRMRESKND